MNIIEALVQLRNDLKTWVANNLRVKLDKNLGAEESGKVLSVDSEGNVITSTMPLIATVPAGWMRGDVDHDGFVTSNDADLILKYAVSTVQLDGNALLAANIDKDGEIGSKDALVVYEIEAKTEKYGSLGDDLTGNWTANPNYETEEAQFYTTIDIPTIKATDGGNIIILSADNRDIFVKATSSEGKLNIFVSRCPNENMAIHVIPSTSDGIWTIAGANQYSYAPLYVAATDIGNGNITIDKTNIEIVSAYNIGQEIYCIYKFVNADTEDNMVVILPLSSINIDTETISFEGFYTKEDESIHALELYIDARGRADLYDTTLLTSDDFTAEDREKLDKIGASSGGVSSWNDLTDKPFGEENGFVDVLPLTKYSGFYLDSTFGLYTFSELPTYELAIGNVYIVNWDGIDYECIAQDASALMSGTVALGNLANFGLSGNNEPFVIGVIAGLGAQYFSLTDTEAGGSHDVRIYQEAIIQKKLDPKYIPIPFFGEIRDTILDCTFTDTQDSEGNWSYQCLYEDTSDSTLTIGEYYTVNWNGVKYTCKCIDALGFPAVGNTVAVGGEDNGLPFAIARDMTGNFIGTKAWISMIIAPIDNGIYNCTISGDITKKIDTKYLYQPDWDENNENSGNYIINKPFYALDAGTVILPETEVNCNIAEDDGYIGIIQGVSFVDGYKYEVIFDDVAYLLTYVSYDVGDGVFETLDGTSRPSHFNLVTSSQFSGALIAFASESGAHTIKITLAEEVIKKLDAKYIPEVDGLPEVTINDNNKILVVTNGAWTVQMPASGLPNATSDDNGKVLKVNNGTWAVSAETQELPSVTSDDDGKVLMVSGGVWSTQPSAVELPVVTTDDAGKFLRVNSEGIWVAETIQDVSEVGL